MPSHSKKRKIVIKRLTILSESSSQSFGIIQPQGVNGPVFMGPESTNYLCNYCDAVLIQGIDKPNFSNAAIRCQTCATVNDVIQPWRFSKKPILRRDLDTIDLPLPSYSSFPILSHNVDLGKLNMLSDALITRFHQTQINIPKVLQHYTTGQGMIGIIATGSIWATNVTYLNDSSEFVLAKDLINTYLAEKRNTASEVCSELISRCLVSDDSNALEFGYYISCFCENRDLMSQWRGYGNSGSGYALGFSTSGLSMNDDLQLRRVIYDRQVQVSMIKEVVDSVCSLLEQEYSGKTVVELDENIVLPQFAGFLSVHLQEFMLCFKHHSFAEEGEYRLIFNYRRNKHKQMLKFRAATDKLVPYLELPLNKKDVNLPLLPLIEVTYGPTMHPELAKRSLHQFLDQNNYQHVEVYGSEAPFRS